MAKTHIRILFTQKIQKRKNSRRQNAYQWLPGAGGAGAGKYLFIGYGGLFGGKENALELDRRIQHNVLNDNKWFALECLILCYVKFTLIVLEVNM